MLVIVGCAYSRRLSNHSRTYIRILTCDTLVCHISSTLTWLAYPELQQLLNILGRHLGWRTLPYRYYFTLGIIMGLRCVLLYHSWTIIWTSVIHLMLLMRAVSTAWTLSRTNNTLLVHWIVLLYQVWMVITLICRNSVLRSNGLVFSSVRLAWLVWSIPSEEIASLRIWFRIRLNVWVRWCHHVYCLRIFELALSCGGREATLIRLALQMHWRSLIIDYLLGRCLHLLLLVYILKNRKVIDLSIFFW